MKKTIQFSLVLLLSSLSLQFTSCSSNAADVIAPPNVDFVIDNNNCEAPCIVTFTNRSSGGIEQRWDFGNGDTSTNENAEVLYNKEGTYNVTLSVTNRGGTRSISKEVVIE